MSGLRMGVGWGKDLLIVGVIMEYSSIDEARKGLNTAHVILVKRIAPTGEKALAAQCSNIDI